MDGSEISKAEIFGSAGKEKPIWRASESAAPTGGERAREARPAALVVPEHLLHRPGVVPRVHYRKGFEAGEGQTKGRG
jgi:hypothetical protein